MIRKQAFDALKKIIIEKQYANQVLKNIKHDNINLITLMIYGTLQQYDYCLFQWKDHIKKPVKKEVEILINLAIYQHLFVDKTPNYAIVNETTKIANTLFDGRYKGLVNAILRKVISQPRKDPQFEDALANLSIMHSFQPWILAMWEKQYGHQSMINFAMSSNQAPAMYCKLNTLKATEFPADLPLQPTDVEGCFLTTSEVLFHPAFLDGQILIQDKSAQQVGHFIPIAKGERILDGCAAPGGKSLSMAIKTNNECDILAVDVHPHRVDLINELVNKTQASSITAIHHDVIEYAKSQPEKSFDGILIDAPCSGLGVLKRKPEIKMFISPSDIDHLVMLQQEILDSVAPLVRKGGWLVYATCTINSKENEKQADYFIKNHPDFIQEEDQFIDPSTTHADGFYMVKFKRIS